MFFWHIFLDGKIPQWGLSNSRVLSIGLEISLYSIVHCSFFFFFLNLLFCVSPPHPNPRAPEHLDGLTRTILPSARRAWTSLRTGSAPCRWYILRWGWTPFCLKTRFPFYGRNTETLRGYNLSKDPPLRGHYHEGPEGVDTLGNQMTCWSLKAGSLLNLEEERGKETRTNMEETLFVCVLGCFCLYPVLISIFV